MKKLIYLIVLTLILGMVLNGCTFLSNIGQAPATEQSGITYLTKSTSQNPFVTKLMADGGDPALAIDAGDISVWNNSEYLYVKYVITNSDWCLTETHLAVAIALGGIPQTKKNNPIPGQFPYQCCYDENEGKWLFMTKPEGLNAECSAEWSTETCLTAITYTIPLSEIDEGVEPEASLYIAAHAVVQNDSEIIDGDVDPPIYWTESAWGAGSEFSDKNWATYFSYIVQLPLTLNLYAKDANWDIVPDGANGVLEYYPCGFTFDFVFNGYGLKSEKGYTLIHWLDNWPNLLCLGVGTTDEYGDVHIEGSVDTGNLTDAKIWLVPSIYANCVTGKLLLGWNPAEYLFEGDVITFNDTDVP